ncbi:hypothetical protein V1278_001863 [Bradyrhizobium sp. AZCC 1577]|uniref:hypothetical protein n=1 Tax=Bradyrhizobium sp. AZCC 1577 TaxID=3117019 RepID=UPI002FEEC970
MIIERFVVEYPKRCLTLLELLEPMAREKELVGSFSLLVASSIFLIPYERMRSRHPLHNPRDAELDGELRFLDKKERFLTAGFWRDEPPKDWRFSRIMKHHNDTDRWVDPQGKHPMSDGAQNTINTRKAGEVLRVVRNALAHGNIVYLNAEGRETRNTELRYLGFLSRYEERPNDLCLAPCCEEIRKTAEVQPAEETYRLVVTTEEEFLRFLKKWAAWVARFRDEDLSQAA